MEQNSALLRALAVDAHDATRVMISSYLSAAGLTPVGARDGLQAVAMLRAGLWPALVVTDVDMPHLNGIELVWQIRTMPALDGVPIVVHSWIPVAAEAIGADVWLPKGTAPEMLVNTFKRLVPCTAPAD